MGNFVAQFSVGIERARQGRRFEHRDVMLRGDFADSQSEQVRALRNHAGRALLAILIFQRDRVMRGVGDDDVRLGDFGHHAPPGNLALLGAYPALDLRVAFRFFCFLPCFFLGHPELAVMVP